MIAGRFDRRSSTCAIGAELGHMAQLDHRRAGGSSERQQHREIAVCSDDDEALKDGTVEDLRVGGSGEADVRDVGGVEPSVAQGSEKPRRQVGVDQEPHAGRATGTSRSLTITDAYSRAARMSSRSRYG